MVVVIFAGLSRCLWRPCTPASTDGLRETSKKSRCNSIFKVYVENKVLFSHIRLVGFCRTHLTSFLGDAVKMGANVCKKNIMRNSDIYELTKSFVLLGNVMN